MVFAMGDRRAMGRYEVPIDGSLPGLGMGIILAVFHIAGIVLVFREVL